MQKLKKLLMSLSLTVGIAAPLAIVPVVSAATITENTCAGTALTIEGGAIDCGGAQAGNVDKLITSIVNIFSVIVGLIAVVMIIYGGFRYITSGGDSTRVNGAKNTILYAIIGLIVVALAQIIVRFVLNRTQSSTG